MRKGMMPGRLVLRRFVRDRMAMTGLCLLAAIALFAFLGPLLSPYGEYSMFFVDREGREFEADEEIDFTQPGIRVNARARPGGGHPLGTDREGRDVLTRLMYGGRVSLVVGLGVVLLETLLGALLGGVAGYCGRWADGLVMRAADVFRCIPTLPLVLIVSSILLTAGVAQNLKIYWLMLVLGVLGWADVARLVRGQILALREREFMVAAEAAGIPVLRRIWKHLMPSVAPLLIVQGTLSVSGAVLLESSLSFLGFGVAFPYASWGNMVSAVNDPLVLREGLHIWGPPGLCILLTALSFHFVGDGLRAAFDPRQRNAGI